MSHDPEAAYRECAAHWEQCFTCAQAGGEDADPEQLCPRGRRLTLEWERAELADFTRQRERALLAWLGGGDAVARTSPQQRDLIRRMQRQHPDVWARVRAACQLGSVDLDVHAATIVENVERLRGSTVGTMIRRRPLDHDALSDALLERIA